MSRYPVKYTSGSKKAELNIEDMNTSHLMNAWRKLSTETDVVFDPHMVVACMNTELLARGCKFDFETSRWTLPPKPEEATP